MSALPQLPRLLEAGQLQLGLTQGQLVRVEHLKQLKVFVLSAPGASCKWCWAPAQSGQPGCTEETVGPSLFLLAAGLGWLRQQCWENQLCSGKGNHLA